MLPQEYGKSRLPQIRLAHVFICNTRSNLRRLPSLSVIKPRPDLELHPLVGSNSDCAAHSRASPSAFLVADDRCLRIVELLDFEKLIASAVLIQRFRVLDHYTLAPGSGHTVQLLCHVLQRFKLCVLDQLDKVAPWILFVQLVKILSDPFEALLKWYL